MSTECLVSGTVTLEVEGTTVVLKPTDGLVKAHARRPGTGRNPKPRKAPRPTRPSETAKKANGRAPDAAVAP